jgi:hypothetical protein
MTPGAISVVILKVSAPAGSEEAATKRLKTIFAAQARLLIDMMRFLGSTRYGRYGKRFRTESVVI